MGLKDVLSMIANMLNGWVSMMKREVGEAIKQVVTKLELKATSPPQLMWMNLGSLSSRLDPLDARHMSSSVAISNWNEVRRPSAV